MNDNSNRNKKKRHRKVPKVPNLGKEFFELLKRHFPKQQNMFTIFNKNTVKLRLSCCRNISSKIFSNNCRINNPPPTNYGRNRTYRSVYQVLYINRLYLLQTNQIKNTLEYLKLLSKTVTETIREILRIQSMLIEHNCSNTSGN